MASLNRRVWYALVMVFVSCIAMVTASISYTNYATRQAEKRADAVAQQNIRNFCEVVSTLDDAYRAQPPTTPTGQHLAEEMHLLRMSLGCPTK